MSKEEMSDWKSFLSIVCKILKTDITEGVQNQNIYKNANICIAHNQL